ncbi:hypothetical protein ACQPYA_04210 [Micromonospora sp. CA-263727]|uniref:hypothetical protein n=1 Tax=Micromonospora sp. CA-263727 TaxID=3239967 RepID=UPI003D8DFE69
MAAVRSPFCQIEKSETLILTVVSQVIPTAQTRYVDHWSKCADQIKAHNPDLVFLQKVGDMRGDTLRLLFQQRLGLELYIGRSECHHTGVAWNPRRLTANWHDDFYSTSLMHGYAAVSMTPVGCQPDLRLTGISAHLNEFSAQAATAEAQLLGCRGHNPGGLGIIAGIFGYTPIGDPELAVEEHPLPFRMARFRRSRHKPGWEADRGPSEALALGEYSDVCGTVANTTDNPDLRHVPGSKTGFRDVQAYVTAALLPTVTGYQWTDPLGKNSSTGMVFEMDLNKIDPRHVRSRVSKTRSRAR